MPTLPKPAQFANPPRAFEALPLPKGIKPGTRTYPNRINLPKPPSAVGATNAGNVAKLLAKVPKGSGLVLSLALEGFFAEPAGSNYYDENPQNPIPLYNLQPPEPPKELEPAIPPPFYGGQTRDKQYLMQYMIHIGGGHGNVDTESVDVIIVWGAILGTYINKEAFNQNNGWGSTYGIISNSSAYGASESNPKRLSLSYQNGLTEPKIQILSLTRIDGQSDLAGNPPAISNGSSSAPGNSLGVPIAAAPNAAPSPAPIASPSNANAPQPNKSIVPAPTPKPGGIPQPQLQLQRQPEPQPQSLPFAEPAPKPGLNLGAPPGASPSPTPAPALTQVPLQIFPAQEHRSPTQVVPKGSEAKPTLNIAPTSFTPNPTTGNPEPKAPTLIPIPTTPTPTLTPIEEISKEVNKYLAPIAIATAAITALVQPSAIKSAASAATCEAFSPTGCAAPVANNAQEAASNSASNNVLLKAIMALLQFLQTAVLGPILAGVNLINTKLGPVMSGVNGIGGSLSRVSSAMGIDRALNLIAIASNLHNAMMLSANLKITLLEMLSSVGNATGLLQTPDGDNVDLNQVFNSGIEQVLINILGVESYAGLKVGLRKYNAIYQAATNSLNAVSSMFNSLGNVVEQGAEYTGKIGNSLRGAGVVVENAYSWMSEKFDAKSNKFIKFQTKIGDVTQVLETINEIAESVVEGQQAATEFQKANTEFIKAVEDAKKGVPIENKEVKLEAEKAKENATKDPTGEVDTGLLSFLSN